MQTSVTLKIRKPRLTKKQKEDARKTEYHRIVAEFHDTLSLREKYSRCMVGKQEYYEDPEDFNIAITDCLCPVHRWWSLCDVLYDKGFQLDEY